jgi:glycosyltransferase involved in cell wall biosynthesis
MNKFLIAFIVLIIATLGISTNLTALSSGVAVPCYYKHFKYLNGLLKSLSQQTRLPDEVVISLSQVENLATEEVDALESGPWPFPVEIIRREGVFMEGANRTTAAKHCSSDVILCIDADDLPHPQRIEAVLQLFENLPSAVMVLCGHAYCPGESVVCEGSIPFFSPAEYAALRFELGPSTWLQLYQESELTCWKSGVHNGSPSIRRTALDGDVYWSDLKNGADQEFNRLIFQMYRETYLIQLPVLLYCNARSSGADIGR